MSESKTTLSIGTSCFIPIIASIVVLAISHDIYAAASMFVIAFVYNISILLSMIPVVGVFIQHWFIISVLNPWLVSISITVPASVNWVVDVAFWTNIAIGFFVTILSSVGAYDLIKSR